MGRKFKYTSLQRIISKLYRDLSLEEISETDVVEWAGEALEGIGTIALYEEAVAFVEVVDHHAEIPCGLHSIIQIARDNQWDISKSNALTPANILSDLTDEEIIALGKYLNGSSTEPVTTEGVPLDPFNNLWKVPEMAYYRPYYDLQWEYSGWMNSKMYAVRFIPVRLATHSFFNSVVCPEESEIYSNSNIVDEYNIVGDRLRFSFKSGYVGIAYHRQVVEEETGYPMIPDDYAVITAITMYITMKYMSRMWYLGREGYADKMQKSEQDWHWYCKQAGNVMLAPYGEDEYQNLLEGRKQLIPRHNKYYGYFGNLGKNLDRGWSKGNLNGGSFNNLNKQN
jgi:hypothetical protein